MGHAGRPRKEGPRTRSGLLSRAASAYQDDRGPLLVRQRHHHLTPRQAKDQRAATALGRLAIKGTISEVEYGAGEAFRNAVAAYRRAIKAPAALVRTDPKGRPLDTTTPAYEDWVRRATAKYDELTLALHAVQNQHRGLNLRAALDRIVLEDQDAPHLVTALRFALLGIAIRMGWRAP